MINTLLLWVVGYLALKALWFTCKVFYRIFYPVPVVPVKVHELTIDDRAPY